MTSTDLHNNNYNRKNCFSLYLFIEIRSVAGEPNYKSVNLTWEIEFVPSTQSSTSTSGHGVFKTNTNNAPTITNSSFEVEPPNTFQIFFCELQTFGPHRCRSKLVDDTTEVPQQDGEDDDFATNGDSVKAALSK